MRRPERARDSRLGRSTWRPCRHGARRLSGRRVGTGLPPPAGRHVGTARGRPLRPDACGKQRAEDRHSLFSFLASVSGRPPGARRLLSASGTFRTGTFLPGTAGRTWNRTSPVWVVQWHQGRSGTPQGSLAAERMARRTSSEPKVTGAGRPGTVLPPGLPGPEASHLRHRSSREVTA